FFEKKISTQGYPPASVSFFQLLTQLSPVKVSIITVVYNSVDTIAAALQSVLGQDYPDIEYIVIDGQSTDGTQEVIQQHQPHIDVFISEKDEGLYDALNKGISLASGEIVGILHADDLFSTPQVISDVVAAYRQKDVDCVYGDLVYVDRTHTDTVIRT
ncbi:glycosyltransferase family 2 protein, partial [Burkholderia cenocepacia]|uniref:glycosyltransferase family 2 protein n=1 Tax=Burkholderia cenocepacia TaxID=95486 RepID=UPI002B24F5F0